MMRRASNRSISEPPTSNNTVGTLLTAMIPPTANGSAVTSNTSHGNTTRSN